MATTASRMGPELGVQRLISGVVLHTTDWRAAVVRSRRDEEQGSRSTDQGHIQQLALALRAPVILELE
jgi:hypothetical protein